MYIAVFCHPQADWKPAWTNVRNDISCWQQTTCETDVPQNLATFHLEAPQNFPSLARSCHTRKNIPIPLASVTSNGTLCLNLAFSRVLVFAAFIKQRRLDEDEQGRKSSPVARFPGAVRGRPASGDFGCFGKTESVWWKQRHQSG